jgi:hypothetical protein
MEKEKILQIFNDYLFGGVRFNDLEDWLLSHLQGILHSGEQEAIALIDQVDALLIEIGAGGASEQELFNTISGILSEAATVRIELSINEAPDITFDIIEQNTEDSPTAGPAAFDFSPHFA